MLELSGRIIWVKWYSTPSERIMMKEEFVCYITCYPPRDIENLLVVFVVL